MKKIIALCTMMAVTFSGCTLKKFIPEAEEMPSDKPWNRTIMETDNGYYYGANECLLSLRYTERSNGADIFLCAKPECTHNGEDTCAATYQFLNVSNYIMYDGAIYFVANTPAKDTMGCSLYRASLDGSSLDKIGDVRRVKHPGDDQTGWGDMPEFLIHKGYAYIPYQIGDSNSYTSFIENGFAKMNIKTGEVEMIFSSDKFMTAKSADLLGACGDYVYYGADGANISNGGLFRYNINTGESQEIKDGALGEALNDKHVSLKGITEKTLYIVGGNPDIHELYIKGFSADTYEPTGFKVDIEENWNYDRILYYDDKVFIVGNGTIEVYSGNGELIGKHDVQPYISDDVDKYNNNYDGRRFDISDNKLYVGYYDDLPEKLDGKFHMESYFSWYYCPIENIVAGTGDWTKAYTIKKSRDYWKEEPVPKFIEENVIPKYQQE